MSLNRTLAVVWRSPAPLHVSARNSRDLAAERPHPRPRVRAFFADGKPTPALVVVGGRERARSCSVPATR